MTGVALTYAPVGFGSHHWWADTGTQARFVTLDDLRGEGRSSRLVTLCAAMSGARAAADHLSAVVAPVPATDGQVVQLLDGACAVTVFEVQEAPRLSRWSTERRAEATRLLAHLHDCTPRLRALPPDEQFSLPGRSAVVRALESLTETGPPDLWMTGPYALPTRQLLARGADDLTHALNRHDRMAAVMRQDRRHWVATHGEPHTGNLLVGAQGLLLIDWDTMRRAPAARDLWHVDQGDGEQIARYTAYTGRSVPAEELDFYRLQWDLLEVCSYVAWFSAAHTATADAEIAWGGLVEAFSHLERRHRGR